MALLVVCLTGDKCCFLYVFGVDIEQIFLGSTGASPALIKDVWKFSNSAFNKYSWHCNVALTASYNLVFIRSPEKFWRVQPLTVVAGKFLRASLKCLQTLTPLVNASLSKLGTFKSNSSPLKSWRICRT